MIVWADTEKFAQWEKFLPAPKIRLRRELSGESNPVAPASLPGLSDTSHLGLGVQNPEPPVPQFPTPSEPLFPPKFDGLAPSLESKWSGFADDIGEPFSALEAVVDQPDPPILPPYPSRKRQHSPDPPQQAAAQIASPPPPAAVGGGMPGFTAEQVASLHAIVQSCLLPAPAPQVSASPSVPDHEPLAEERSPPPPVPVSAFDLPPPQESPYDDNRPGPSWESDPPMTPRSFEGESEIELVVLSDGAVGDGTSHPKRSPPFSGSGRIGTHIIWHDLPAAIPPVLMAGLQNHVESSIYYCGSRIQYVWYRNLPQLLLIDGTGREGLALPVDQDFVRVFREGGHMAFSIAEPAEVLHAIFRPFVLAALRTRPKTLRADPPPRDGLRSLAALDLVRKVPP